MSIRYDDNDDKPERIAYYVLPFNDSPTRYELPNRINSQSTVTDFIESFQYVYEVNDDIDQYNIIATYVEEKDGKFTCLSKKDMCKRKEKYVKNKNKALENGSNFGDKVVNMVKYSVEQDPIYEISVYYYSYDCIASLEISTVYSRDSYEWNTYLSEIE